MHRSYSPDSPVNADDEQNLYGEVYEISSGEDEGEQHAGSDYEGNDTEDDAQVLSTRVQGYVDQHVSAGPLEDSVEVAKCTVRGKGYFNGNEEGSETQYSQEDWLERYGLICSICMEPWTSDGQHHISCLPCGHLFGLSCITRWIKQQGRSSKCPQCNKKCARKDVRKLFTSSIAAVDEESQKRIHSLESKCHSLGKQVHEWCRKESEWKKKETILQDQLFQLSERNRYLEHLLVDKQTGNNQAPYDARCQDRRSGYFNLDHAKHLSKGVFRLQAELQLDYGRVFDINASGQLLFAQRRLNNDSSHVLTKIYFASSHKRDIICLPANTKFVKDLHISPRDENLVLCATLGKKLLVVCSESKSVIYSYELPVAAWSCSWDRNSSFYTYAGLQNGCVSVFDVRQTVGPVESHCGHSTNPVHTIYSMFPDPTLSSEVRRVLSASSSGLCQWNFGGCIDKPFWVHETPIQEVCISLAFCASSNDIVASYRPRADCVADMASSQPVSTPAMSRGIQGCHRHMRQIEGSFKLLGDTHSTVSDVRLPRSVIIDRENENPLFACGDETTFGLLLRDLPTFSKCQYLKPHQRYICDVKYSHGFLCSMSEDRLQIFHN